MSFSVNPFQLCRVEDLVGCLHHRLRVPLGNPIHLFALSSSLIASSVSVQQDFCYRLLRRVLLNDLMPPFTVLWPFATQG